MKTIFVHIGNEKTGTTTLQSFLTKNEKNLNRFDFTYLQNSKAPYFYRNAHFPIAASLFEECPTFLPKKKYQKEEKIFLKLKNDILNSKKNIILSCEHFSSRLESFEVVKKFSEHLKIDGYNIKIIYYIRNQADLAVSSYFTSIFSGSVKKFNEYLMDVNTKNRYFNFLETLNLWSSFFGVENMIVKKYDARFLCCGDIRKDFLNVIGIKKNKEFSYGKNLNVSVSRRQIEILRILNMLFLSKSNYLIFLKNIISFYKKFLLPFFLKNAENRLEIDQSQRFFIESEFKALNEEIRNIFDVKVF